MWCRAARPAARVAAVALIAAGLAAPPQLAAAAGEDPLRLKPGARGKLCLDCHADFREKLSLVSVHTPVRGGDCTSCHSPHASSHGKLLAEEPERVCLRCHERILPARAASAHEVASRGRCVRCHDPHASDHAGNLLRAGNELCFGCHEDLGRAMASAFFKHAPAERSCLACHDPHASTRSQSLLVREEPALCTSCHKPDAPAFVRAHAGYPVARGRCTSCHDPHGSSERGLLWASAHPPVAARQCAQCHAASSSADPLATKRTGLGLCRSCHASQVNAMLSARRIHWPLLDPQGCLHCHAPHGAKEKPLLREPMKPLCGSCHGDVLRRAERSKTKHPPVEEGACATCHAPHAGEEPFLLSQPSLEGVCETCHDWKAHSSHPIGDRVVDPRNRNLRVDCASCHRSHGTPHEHLTHLDSKRPLCLECHEEFGR